jgi:formate-dependent nitrite reductase membrane component NrfD
MEKFLKKYIANFGLHNLLVWTVLFVLFNFIWIFGISEKQNTFAKDNSISDLNWFLVYCFGVFLSLIIPFLYRYFSKNK